MTDHPRPKLVEVTLPLEEISRACRKDKDRKTGTIKNVHKWFAPMPTPAWRALLFASLVDDPGEEDLAGRAKLVEVVKRLVPADGGAPSAEVLAEAQAIIHEATGGDLPTVYDPFCGGGSTLVEAQRLGLPTAGSDLNPVPVLITRVLTELVPQMAGRPPLLGDVTQLPGMQGGPLNGFLADCRHYAQRVREEVWGQIGHLYPEPPGGGKVIAWLWARTVVCPNPACRAIAPLVSSFWLSKKRGALTWLQPVPQGPGQPVRFEVVVGEGGTAVRPSIARTAGRCLTCDEPFRLDYVRQQGQNGTMGVQLLAVVVDETNGRSYRSVHEAGGTVPAEIPRNAEISLQMPAQALGFRTQLYGMDDFADLFTDRQLTMLAVFADAVAEVPAWVASDGGDEQEATAIASVLGLCMSRLAQASSTQSRWNTRITGSSKAEPAFSRHALPMVWDFTETSPWGGSVGDWIGQLDSISTGLRSGAITSSPTSTFQADARVGGERYNGQVMVATDPPYFAQIGYADLSDFFYMWQRRALAAVHPDLYVTVATPKAPELIAAPYRHGGIEAATAYFIRGFTETFRKLKNAARPDLPMLIVYAHRQEETGGEGAATSTAWDAMLTAILDAGLRIVGTWPIHGTRNARQISIGTNALASYVVLVCRPQLVDAPVADLPQFRAALRTTLPRAIKGMQRSGISAIDLGQATLGPGMAVFSRFARVIDPVTGQRMTVSAALQVIGSVQGEVLDEFVGDTDSMTRWARLWYREHGFGEGPFDHAEKISKITVTSPDLIQAAGIATVRRSKVTLLGPADLPSTWTPDSDVRPNLWLLVHHLVARLRTEGERAAADLLRPVRHHGEDVRNLLYWLSLTAVASGRAADALAYDALVTSWPQITKLAAAGTAPVEDRLAT